MAWSHVGTTNAQGASATAPTVPPGTASGDLMILFAANYSAATPVVPGGWTRCQGWSAAGIVQAWYKIAGGAETAPTVSGDTLATVIAVLTVHRGHDPAAPHPAGGGTKRTNASSTASTADGLTVGRSGSMLVHVGKRDTSSTTHTPPAGFTEPTNGDQGWLTVSYRHEVPSGATGAVAGTWATTDTSTAGLLLFQAEASAVVATPARQLLRPGARPGPLRAGERRR